MLKHKKTFVASIDLGRGRLRGCAGLCSDPDGERERFLGFERWWKVSTAWAARRSWPLICDDHLVDLKRIRNPLVIFASYGNNITHQALSWIPAVYNDTAALKTAGQRIVYCKSARPGL